MRSSPALAAAVCCAALCASMLAQSASPETRLREILDGDAPKDVGELRAMQAHVQALLEAVLPATVALEGATGVLVDGGLVLTAGHVTTRAGRKMRITLQDGRVVDGESLGANLRTDVAVIRILTEGDYPARPMGQSGELQVGEWCLMLGEPSGHKDGRSTPARLGRVLSVPAEGYIVTDCPMQAGDSGGPLFDMDGNVIGVNSRISGNLAQNMHSPIDAFRAEWDDLLAGKVTEAPTRGGRASIGLRFQPGPAVRIREVVSDSPADKAGLLPGDAIVKVDGKDVPDRFAYGRAMRERKSPDEVVFEVLRGEDVTTVRVQYPKSDR